LEKTHAPIVTCETVWNHYSEFFVTSPSEVEIVKRNSNLDMVSTVIL